MDLLVTAVLCLAAGMLIGYVAFGLNQPSHMEDDKARSSGASAMRPDITPKNPPKRR